MIKKFLSDNKIFVEIVAIFIAIGALFIAVPLPSDNPAARQALLNVQVAWLLIITLAIIIIFFYVITAISLVEKEISDKNKLDLGGTASLIVGFFLLWILYYLWKYMVIQYRDSLKNLLLLILQPIILIDLGISVLISRKLLYIKQTEPNKIQFYFRSFGYIFINGLVMGTIVSILSLDFSLHGFIITTLVFSFFSFIFETLYLFFNRKS
jgi:hypothetical protein